MSEKKKMIIKDIINYSSSQYISQFLGFFTATFTRRFLGPANMGIWQILTVVLSYATNTHLGTTDTLYYKTPILKGEGKPAEAEKVKNTVFSFITTISFISSAVIIIYAFYFQKTLSKEMFYGLLAIAMMLILQRIYTFYITLLRASKEFSVLGKSIIFDAILGFLAVFFVLYRFRLYGLFLVVIVTPILNVLFITRYLKYDLRYTFNFEKLVSYIKFGFPLFIQGWMLMVLNSIDKIMISRMLGLEALGFYSIALMVKGYGANLPKNFSMVISPHLLEDFGRTQDVKKISRYITVPAFINAYFMSFVLGIVFIVSIPFVKMMLPKFVPGIDAMRVFLLAIFFFSLVPEASHSLIAMNKQIRILPILGIAILANIFFNYVFIKSGFNITGASMATSITGFIYFIFIFVYAMKHFESPMGIVKFLSKLFFPLLYSTLTLFIIEKTVHHPDLVLDAGLKLITFLIAFSPLVFYLNNKTRIIDMFFSAVKDRLFKAKKES